MPRKSVINSSAKPLPTALTWWAPMKNTGTLTVTGMVVHRVDASGSPKAYGWRIVRRLVC